MISGAKTELLGIDPTEIILTPRLTLLPFNNLYTPGESSPTLPPEILTKLHAMTLDGDLFRFIPIGPFPTPQDLNTFFTQVFPQRSLSVMYVIKHTETGQVVGAVGFQGIRNGPPHYGVLDLGPIFVDAKCQGTGFGPEVVAAMTKYAIEDRGYHRVEWKAHHENVPSHKCALKIGYVFEGTFRKFLVFNGKREDIKYFSMTSEEYFNSQDGDCEEPKRIRIQNYLDECVNKVSTPTTLIVS